MSRYETEGAVEREPVSVPLPISSREGCGCLFSLSLLGEMSRYETEGAFVTRPWVGPHATKSPVEGAQEAMLRAPVTVTSGNVDDFTLEDFAQPGLSVTASDYLTCW
jgi:hypothetical protein